MTSPELKISELKLQLRQVTERMDQICTAWAEDAEVNLPSFPELEGSLLKQSRILQSDILRETENLKALQDLLGRLTSLQTKKRTALQKKAQGEKIYAHQLEDLGAMAMESHLSVPGTWLGVEDLFADSDHYRAKYDFLMKKQASLRASPGGEGILKSLGLKASSLLTSLRISRTESRQRSSLSRLALRLISRPDLRPRIADLLQNSSEINQTAFREICQVLDQLEIWEGEEAQVKAALETYGASISPTRRLAEMQRTLQALQTRLGDLRLKRGRNLFREAERFPGDLQPGEWKYYQPLTDLDRDCRSLKEDLLKFQAEAEILALEDRNSLLSDKIRSLEEQIRHHNQEIAANQRLIQEKRKISGEILP